MTLTHLGSLNYMYRVLTVEKFVFTFHLITLSFLCMQNFYPVVSLFLFRIQIYRSLYCKPVVNSS